MKPSDHFCLCREKTFDQVECPCLILKSKTWGKKAINCNDILHDKMKARCRKTILSSTWWLSQGHSHCLAHHTYSVDVLWMRRCRMNGWMNQRCRILNRDTLHRRWAQPLSLPVTGTVIWMCVDNQDSTRGSNKDKRCTESGKPHC